jgi:PAS domain S-box-containing protein
MNSFPAVETYAPGSLIDKLPAIVYVCEPEPPYRTMYISSAVESLGYSTDEWLSEPCMRTRLIHTDDRNRVLRETEEASRAGTAIEYEYRMIAADGQVRWVHDLGRFARDEEGRRVLQGVMIDITRRRRAEEEVRRAETALRESELKYRTILENIQDGYYEVDLKGNFTFFNDPICRILGYEERDELNGMNHQRYTDRENTRKVCLAYNTVYRTGEPIKGYAYEVIRKDGAKRYVEASVSLLTDAAGHHVGFRGIIRDITARRQMEAALWQSEREYRKLFENANDAILIFDPESEVILEANNKALDIYGVGKEEFIGMSLKTITTDSDQGRQPIREALESGSPKNFETVHLRKDGMPIDIFGSSTVIEYGGRKAVMTIARDVTEIKRLQQQLIQSEKLAALGQLVSGVAHELNNPLTSVIGYTQLLLARNQLDPRAAEQLEIVGNEADRARRIVRNLLSFSRQHKPSRAEVDLNELLERTLELRAYEMKVNNISVCREPGDIPCVLADEHQLQQVFLNIIINAEQAMQSDARAGELTVRTEMGASNRVKIVIADNGPGIPLQIIEKLFDPFFTTKPVGKGTGLGLSISYGIVKEHDGAIRVESEPGRGARFIIELPTRPN